MRILAISPHPDDETLGCGGTLLRRAAEGAELGWLIVTGVSEKEGWPADRVRQREEEIARVAKLLGFGTVHNLGLPTTRLDVLPMRELIDRFSSVFSAFEPDEVLVPHRSDVHTDHRVVFDAAAACAKWFRHPSVRRFLTYETISETEFGLESSGAFQPNSYVDISDYLERKLDVMAVYRSEMSAFPFPRSVEAIRALATWRGANAGCMAAEAFQLLRERR